MTICRGSTCASSLSGTGDSGMLMSCLGCRKLCINLTTPSSPKYLWPRRCWTTLCSAPEDTYTNTQHSLSLPSSHATCSNYWGWQCKFKITAEVTMLYLVTVELIVSHQPHHHPECCPLVDFAYVFLAMGCLLSYHSKIATRWLSTAHFCNSYSKNA